MVDNYVTIGDLEQIQELSDTDKLLIDNSTRGDTKSAFVSVLKSYLTKSITPSINETTKTWFIGNTDTGVSIDSGGIDIWTEGENYKIDTFVYYNNQIFKCITSPQTDNTIFNELEWNAVSSNISFATNDEITTMINTIWEVSDNE